MHIKKSLLKNKKLLKVLFYIYLGFVFLSTLSPVKKIEPSFLQSLLFDGADKIVHAGIFTVLAILYYISYKPKFIRILILVAIVGILIEIFQKLLPTGRSFEWADWIFDLLGGLLGLLVIYICNRKKRNSKNVKFYN